MRFEGRLSAWTALRGYGAIAPLEGGQELFVHVSAFPTDGEQPLLGELLSFEVVTGRDGRKEAVRVQRSKRRVSSGAPALSTQPSGRRAGAHFHQQKQLQRRLRTVGVCATVLALLGGLVWLDLHPDAGGLFSARLTDAAADQVAEAKLSASR